MDVKRKREWERKKERKGKEEGVGKENKKFCWIKLYLGKGTSNHIGFASHRVYTTSLKWYWDVTRTVQSLFWRWKEGCKKWNKNTFHRNSIGMSENTIIRSSMPQTSPSSLSRHLIWDVVASTRKQKNSFSEKKKQKNFAK